MIANRTFTLASGAEHADTVKANFVRCLASSGQLLQVQTENMDGSSSSFEIEAGLALQVKPFQKVRILNKGDQIASCRFVYSDEGFVQDNRLVGNLDLNGSVQVLSTLPLFTRYESVAVVGADHVIAPSNANRRSMTVYPQGQIELATGKTTSDAFEWNVQQELRILNSDGVVIEIYEDHD